MKRFTPEQIVSKLREPALARGPSVPRISGDTILFLPLPGLMTGSNPRGDRFLEPKGVVRYVLVRDVREWWAQTAEMWYDVREIARRYVWPRSSGGSGLMSIRWTFEEIRRPVRYVGACRSVAFNSTGAIAVGVVQVAVSMCFLRLSQWNAVPGAIGLLLIALGVWMRLARSPRGVLLDALGWLIVAAWNLASVAFIYLPDVQPIGGVTFTLLGVMQLGWGIRALAHFRGLGRRLAKPPEQLLTELDGLVSRIRQSKVEDRADTVRLTETPSIQNLGARRQWIGRLLDDCAVFCVEDESGAVIAGTRNGIRLSATPRANGRADVQMRIDERTLRGTVSTVHLRRMQDWAAKKE